MNESPEEIRKSERLSIYVFVECIFLDGDIDRIRVRNISEHGLGGQLETDRIRLRGQRIKLAFRGVGSVSGQIAWVDGKNVGIAFDSPVEPSLVLPGLANRKSA
jgi:PilZ domain